MNPSVSANAGSDHRQLTICAAAQESHPARWEQRFTDLFLSGLLRLPAFPAREVALRMQLPENHADAGLADSFWHRVHKELLTRGCHVNVDLSGLPVSASGRRLQRFLEGLCCCRVVDSSSAPLGLSITAQHPAAAAILALRQGRQLAGLTVALRYSALASHSGLLSWPELVAQSHNDTAILPVPLMAIRPLTGLYASEVGQSVMPASLFEVRADTAWLVLELQAASLGQAGALRRQIATALRFADNLIDGLVWPRPALRLDALLNRRIAMRISGIGDWLATNGQDPRQQATLTRLRRWLLFVRHVFIHESRLLARLRGPFPELGAEELVACLAPRYGVNDARRLVQHQSLRHRHLLALSPFALFPAAGHPSPAHVWLNLIPAIGCADTIAMYGEDVRTRLTVGEWGRLLQLTSAVAANTRVTGQGRSHSGII